MSFQLNHVWEHTAPNSPPMTGLFRLASTIAPHGPSPTSRSTWFAWRREGRAPAPIQLSPRITAYRAEDVHALLAELSQANNFG